MSDTPNNEERHRADRTPVHAEIVNDYTPSSGSRDDTPPHGYRNTYEVNGQTIPLPSVRPIEPRAVIAMTLAVLSWFILPVIGSIPAIWYGFTAKQHIRWSDGRYAGSGLASLAIGVAVANLIAVAALVTVLVWVIGAIF